MILALFFQDRGLRLRKPGDNDGNKKIEEHEIPDHNKAYKVRPRKGLEPFFTVIRLEVEDCTRGIKQRRRAEKRTPVPRIAGYITSPMSEAVRSWNTVRQEKKKESKLT